MMPTRSRGQEHRPDGPAARATPSRPRRRTGTAVRVVLAAVTAVLVAACGSGATEPGGDATIAPPGFPVTVDSCGRTLTFDAPPQRVVILSPMIAVDLIALGVADRIVGQSGTDFFVPPPETADVPVLSPGESTNTEALLGAQPDLIISEGSYRLDPAQGGASRDQLDAAGITSYVSAAGCDFVAGEVGNMFTDLENLGRIFGVGPQAQALAQNLRANLADVEGRVAGRPAVPSFAGTVYDGGQYYPVSGIGLEALRVAGGESIFPQVDNPNAPVSTEAITGGNPQAFVYQTSYPRTLDERRVSTELAAAFPTVPAIRDNRLLFINYFSAALPGSAIETVGSIRRMATFLHPTAFGG